MSTWFMRIAVISSLAKIFTLSLILCLPIIINAEPQDSRAREVNKESAGRKRTAKPRPLTAREHREAEQRLAALGYWTGPVDGRWDDASRHALIAFQKVEGLKRTGQMTRGVFDALVNAVRPTPLETGPAHIEVDLIRQVLFEVDETGTVTRILPVSTGSGKPFKSQGWVRDAITHPGRYKIYIKLAGWKKSPLGMMYYPSYFMYGTAIHGYQSVPTKPASHGCIRIPMFAAKKFYRDVPMGMSVIVHKGVSPKPAVILSGESRN
jgi:peptidoglycan hydrolase-like protein with peptidoglycan-binding domain